jgi:hypothetical protein
MASSQDKANALKDSYVKGLINDLGGAGEQGTLAGTGLQTPSPEIASHSIDLGKGTFTEIQDGKDSIEIKTKDGQTVYRNSDDMNRDGLGISPYDVGNPLMNAVPESMDSKTTAITDDRRRWAENTVNDSSAGSSVGAAWNERRGSNTREPFNPNSGYRQPQGVELEPRQPQRRPAPQSSYTWQDAARDARMRQQIQNQIQMQAAPRQIYFPVYNH